MTRDPFSPRHTFTLRSSNRSASSAAAAAVLGALLAVAPAARAADPVPDPFAGDSDPSGGGAAAPANRQGPPSAPAEPTEPASPGIVERLPASAFPEPMVRGLYGGSMWLNMHGLQWPYYPRTGIGISGYGWLDNSYEKIRVGDNTQPPSTTEYLQQGRFVLRVTPTYSRGDWFVQAQAEIVANRDQSQTQPARGIVDTDDLWIRTGVWNKWDVTIGRFEAFEVYHLGMGLDLNTEERQGAYDAQNRPPDLYGATFLFYRAAGPGNLALHLYPHRWFRVELLGQMGNDGGLNEVGGRPAVIFDIGWFKAKAAAEYQLEQARNDGDQTQKKNYGFAGTAQVVLAPIVELGVNVGSAVVDVHNNIGVTDNNNSGDQLSLGGFLNARLITDTLLGVGANYTAFTNLHRNDQGNFDRSTNLQAFAAVQYLINKQLFVKLVGAYAKSHFEKSFASTPPFDDDMYSVRLRFQYLF